MSHHIFEPGMFVRCPDHPEWGLGQVQSRAGDLVTVNFAQMGKQVMNVTMIHLEVEWNPQNED